MKFIEVNSTTLSIIRDLAYEIWPVTYQPILQKEQIEFMLAEIYSLSSLEKQQKEGQYFVLLVDENDENLGFMSYSSVNESHCKLNKLYLRGIARSKGAGKKMIEWVGNKALQEGHCVLTLNVHRENKAVQFYQKMGFEIKEIVDIPFGEYVLTDYVMEKKLA